MCGKLTNLLTLLFVLGLVGAVANHAAGAVAIWRFEDGAGDVAIDSTGNGYDGSLRNNPTWGDGENGGGLWFSNAEAQKVIAPIPQLNTLTVTMWALYTDNPATNIGLLHVQTGEDDNTDPASKIIGMWVENTTLLWGRIIPAGAGNVNFPKNATVEANVWNHYAMVIDADSGKATQYLNGEAVGEVDYSGELSPYTFANIGRQGSESWEGGIDEVAIFDRALSADQIKAVMSDIETGFPLAYGPDPADGAMLEATWVNLSWGAGDYAASHDVYLSDNFDDVNNGAESAFQGNLGTTSLIAGFFGFAFPDGLVPGTTYYWRIDEVNDAHPNSPWKGPVWNFRIQPRTAYDNSPADGTINVLQDVTLNWTAGMGASLHQVYFGDNLDEVSNAVGATMQTDAIYTPATLEAGKTYYWRVDEFDGIETQKGEVWSFNTVPNVAITEPRLVGWWTFDEGTGATAVDWSGHGHHGNIIGEAQWAPDGMNRGCLVLDGGTNHVVVEGMLDSGVVLAEYTMAVWFRADRQGGSERDLIAAYEDGPTFGTLVEFRPNGTMRFLHRSTTGGTGADILTTATYDDGAWHHVAVVKTANELIGYIDGEVAVSDVTTDAYDGSFYVAFGVLDHLRANGRFFPGPLDDARIYDKALTAEEIAQIMLGDPKLAGNPIPNRHVSVDIGRATSLDWSAGDAATSHDVYFGSDGDAIAAASNDSSEFQGNQTETSLSLAGLVEFGGGDYYWRVDEVATDGTVTAGTVWKFTVPDYLLVDDFESYNEINEGEPGSNRVYLTWIDGYGTTTNGAVAGNLGPPIMSQGHNSAQAMPLLYDNNSKFSEVTKTLVYPTDWTAEGAGNLSLWIQGESTNVAERLYVAANGAAVYHEDPALTQKTTWTEWVIPLQAFADKGVDLTKVNTISIGLGDKNNIVAGGTGAIYVDDIRLYRP